MAVYLFHDVCAGADYGLYQCTCLLWCDDRRPADCGSDRGRTDRAALALVFMAGATTGGIDIIVKVVRTKRKHIKTNILFLLFDSMVILASWIVFRDLTVAFYAGIAVVTDSIVMDKILYGSDEAKLTYIVSAKPAQMKQRLFDDLDTTATVITARGAYTNEPKELLMIVTRKQIYPKLEEVVKDEDPTAFMIVSSASEIFGEGYKDITRDKI